MASFDPQPWTPPKAPPREGIYAENSALTTAELWETGGIGPEDVAVAGDGTVFTGLEDGTILRFPAAGGNPVVIANTGGRPLGVELESTGSLIVCDADKGLLRVTPDGEVVKLADSFGGERFVFTNNATIAADGTIYFTVSSRRYGFDEYVDDILEHSGTGRLFAARPDGTLTLLQSDLQFANGIALNADESSLYVAETGSYAVNRLHLTGPRTGSLEPFLANLPGYPDNLSFAEERLWIAFVSPRQPRLEAMMSRVWVRKLMRRMPERLAPKPLRHGLVLGFTEDGELTHNLQDPSGRVAATSGVRLHDGKLYIGSLTDPTIAVHTL